MLKKFGGGLVACAALAASLSLSSIADAHQYQQNDVTIVHPWSRATPAAAKVGGGYMHLFNKGHGDDRLESITSPVSDRIEMHEMAVENGVMKMRKLDQSLPIPAHSDIVFQPGGFHIMFLAIKKPFVENESFPATLHFQKAGDVNVSFKVVAMGKSGAMHGHDMHSHGPNKAAVDGKMQGQTHDCEHGHEAASQARHAQDNNMHGHICDGEHSNCAHDAHDHSHEHENHGCENHGHH